MLFLAVLFTSLVLVRFATRRRRQPRDQVRLALAIAMASAGAAHFAFPTPFVQHLPGWVPGRLELVWISGAAEIALGAALLGREGWRRVAGLALAGYLLAVFPANVYVAVAGVDVVGQPGGIYPWVRLPLQFLFVWLAVWSTSRPQPRARAAPAGATAA